MSQDMAARFAEEIRTALKQFEGKKVVIATSLSVEIDTPTVVCTKRLNRAVCDAIQFLIMIIRLTPKSRL